MSLEAINNVRQMDIRPCGRKFVAMALADYADENGSCYPSVETLARYTSQGEKTVRDHLKALEEMGFLTRERSRNSHGQMGQYRYTIHHRRNLPVAKSASGEKRHSPPAKSAGHIHQTLSTNVERNSKSAREEKTPLPDDWEPRSEEIALCRELKFTDQEIADVVDDFRTYWPSRARTAKGRKTLPMWHRTFRNSIRGRAAAWRTEQRSDNGGRVESMAATGIRMLREMAGGEPLSAERAELPDYDRSDGEWFDGCETEGPGGSGEIIDLSVNRPAFDGPDGNERFDGEAGRRGGGERRDFEGDDEPADAVSARRGD